MLEGHKGTIIRILIAIAIFITASVSRLPFSVSLIVYMLAYVIAGINVIKTSVLDIMDGEFFDENFLMLIATIGAFVTGQYIEAIAVMIIYEIGEMLQDKAVDDSKKAITALMDIRPKYANLQKGNTTTKVLPKNVKVGDIIVVGAGESIPLDGVIIKGETRIDFSSLTGESRPKHSKEGDTVYSGGVNLQGTVYIKVNKSYEESTISKVLDFIEKANNQKSRTESIMTRFSKKYTPVVIIIALLFVALSGNILFMERIKRACMFLVIACPCALVLSLPLSFFYGIGVCSKNGILVKGGIYLEKLADIKSIIFDKTGTLTKGVFKVTKVYDIYNKDILKMAAYCEANSTHPIAYAIRKEYGVKIRHDKLYDSQELAGLGTTCKFDDKEILVGNKRLMDKNSVKLDDVVETNGVIYVACDGEYMGYIVVSDNIKDNARNTIDTLKHDNIEVAMITGDSKQIALDVANELGINDIFYEVFPQDKANIVSNYMQDRDSKVAFVGDGINDVPSILTSDVGVAMGGIGSDAAIEAANIVIMDDELSRITKAIQISRKTLRTVKQNIVVILGVKFTILALSAMGFATMWGAILADVGVSLIAVVHSTQGLNKLRRLVGK